MNPFVRHGFSDRTVGFRVLGLGFRGPIAIRKANLLEEHVFRAPPQPGSLKFAHLHS